MTIVRSIFGERSSGRRKVFALAVLLLFLLVVRFVWGAWSGGKADAALATLRARGEPLEAADVVYPVVGDAENAWEVQAQAARNVVPTSPRHTATQYQDYPPYSAQWTQLAAGSEAANVTAFALARQARQLSRVRLRSALTSPVSAMPLGWPLNNAKILANTLADGIAYAHLTGDDGEALERSLDLLHLARSLRQDDMVVSQLVAIGIEALACAQVQTIAPGLRLDAKAATRPATVARVRRLIEVLLDEREAREGLARSMTVERIVLLETHRMRAQGTWVIRPLADHAVVRGLSSVEVMEEAVRAETMPAARQALARIDREETGWAFPRGGGGMAASQGAPRYSRWFDGGDIAMEAYIERHFRVIADRRATAASLACQLFRADQGRWPERLEELVPKYLPRVPVDPFFEDGRAIQYVVYRRALPGGADRPMLVWYSAEMDYGSPAEPTYGWYVDARRQPGNSLHRQYRDVSWFVPPSAPPSTQAVKNDPEEADAPGEEEKPDDQAQ